MRTERRFPALALIIFALLFLALLLFKGWFTDPTSEEKLPPPPPPLKAGSYTISDARLQLPLEKEPYLVTYYHVVVAVSKELPAVQLGCALGGFTLAPRCYLDFDADGQVDQGLLDELIGSIPLGRMIGKRINSEQSQIAFDSFLYQQRAAIFTPLEKLKKEGAGMAWQLYQWAEEHAGDIARQSEILIKPLREKKDANAATF